MKILNHFSVDVTLLPPTHLYTVILFVTHINEAQCIRRHTPWIVEFAIGGALCAKCTQETTGWIEYLDTMIVSIGDNVLTDSIHCNAGQTIEFTFAVAILTKFFHKNTIRIEYLDSGMSRKISISISNGKHIVGMGNVPMI